jgi:hypothetical protein
MTARSLPRILARLLVLAIAALSATYLIVYLYRWEWNRALISGLFFLAAEVAYVGSSLRADVRGLAARVDALESPVGRRRSTVRDTSGARPGRPFAWLREAASGQMNVFVPVLLGAGVILSAAAFVVERIAGMVMGSEEIPTGRGRPVDLDLPPDGLLGDAVGQPAPDRAGANRAWRVGRRVAVVGVLGVLVAAAVDVVGDATQSRPSARVADASTVIELAIDQRSPRPVTEAAEALAVACYGTLHADREFTEITALGADRVRLTVTPALSELRRRRLFGCLQDATLDLVQAHVVHWTTTPTSADTPAGDES